MKFLKCTTNGVMFFFLFCTRKAWIRLSINLEKCGEFAESIEVLRSAYEDSQVRGGERLEVQDRLISRHRKYGEKGLPLVWYVHLMETRGLPQPPIVGDDQEMTSCR